MSLLPDYLSLLPSIYVSLLLPSFYVRMLPTTHPIYGMMTMLKMTNIPCLRVLYLIQLQFLSLILLTRSLNLFLNLSNVDSHIQAFGSSSSSSRIYPVITEVFPFASTTTFA